MFDHYVLIIRKINKDETTNFLVRITYVWTNCNVDFTVMLKNKNLEIDILIISDAIFMIIVYSDWKNIIFGFFQTNCTCMISFLHKNASNLCTIYVSTVPLFCAVVEFFFNIWHWCLGEFEMEWGFLGGRGSLAEIYQNLGACFKFLEKKLRL